MKKIGILTLPFGPNYGMNLQLYALQTLLLSFGYDVLVINRKWNRVKKNSGLLAAIKRFVYYNIICVNIYKFYKKNIRLSQPCYSSEDVAKVCVDNGLDVIIVGSDQVWRIENTRGANFDFFGGFLDNIVSVKILSYAASFGNSEWKGSKDETERISFLLKRFASISVREDSGVKMCKKLFGVESRCSIDPTLLLKSSDYPILSISNAVNNGIVSYILDKTEQKTDFIKKIKVKKGIAKTTELYPAKGNKSHRFKYSIEEWLTYISNAQFVVTDSYHGMIFSIIFKKEFVVIGNSKRGIERFTSLLNKIGLADRLVMDLSTYNLSTIDFSIDYRKVDGRLEQLRNESFVYLKKHINDEK